MKFIINTEKIKSIFSSIQSVCQKRTISEITQCVFLSADFNHLFIKATDLELYIDMQVQLESFSDLNSSNSSCIVNARRLYEIIKDIDDELLKLEIKDDSLNILTSFSEFTLTTYSNEPFPLKDSSVENIFSINTLNFHDLLNYCIPLTSTSLYQQGINSILFEVNENSFKVTSTDGHCLAHIILNSTFPLNKPFSFSLSKRAASDVKKILEISTDKEIFIGKSSSELVINSSNFSIFVKTISEKFPDYKSIINTSNYQKVSCNRESFSKIVRRLTSLTVGKFVPASLYFSKDNNLNFYMNNKEIGTAKEQLSIIPDFFETEVKINVYSPYLLQAASSINVDSTLTLMILDSKKPLIISHNSDIISMLYVIMPMISV
jgi:DNA polymerase III beta subunit